jgi:hypothetical protein
VVAFQISSEEQGSGTRKGMKYLIGIKDYVSYALEIYMIHMDVYIITLLKYIT